MNNMMNTVIQSIKDGQYAQNQLMRYMRQEHDEYM